MSPSKRLKPVRRVTESRERHAARELGASQRSMRDQQARLEELRQYHQEYLERFYQASETGMSSAQLLEYRAFLANLERAIREQEKVVQAGSLECSSRKQKWQHKHMKTQILGKVMNRMEGRDRSAEDAREQKVLDDRSQWNGEVK